MPEIKKQIQSHLRSAEFVPGSFNEENYTVDVVAATDAPVLQMSWDGPVNEVLSMDASSVRMSRLNAGANVLDNHNKYSSVTTAVLGVVKRAWIAAGKLNATIQLSKRDELKGFIQDVKDGIARNISVGYRVYRMLIDESVGDIPTATATDWEPFEISFVSVPADYNSTTRSQSDSIPTNEVTIIQNSKTRNMADEIVIPAAAAAAPVASPPAAAAETTVNVENERKLATQNATTRSVDIIGACRAAGFDIDFAETLIKDTGLSIDGARAAIINKLAEKQSAAPRSASVAVIGDDETVKARNAVEFALMHRAAPGQFEIGKQDNPASAMAVAYRGISVLDAAAILLEQRGIKVNRYDKQDLYARSMSTSDFPNLLSNIANKFLRKEYTQTAQTFKAIATQQNLPDFKAANGIQFGGVASFEEVKEGAEYKFGSFTETVDNWKLSTYGKLFRFTRQMMINDDLNGFIRAARLIAIGAANNESDIFWSIITSNAKVSDNKALFHTDHGNLAGSGAVISAATLSDARTAMRRQTGLTTKEKIEVYPKYLVVAPEQELAADQIISVVTPNQTSQVNPFQGSLLKIVEQRLAATAWYLFADPGMLESFTYGYLNGNEGLYTETQYGFEVDGVTMKARQDFAAKAWDYRGSYKNPGA